jgi:hypothetical protein
MVSSRKRIFSGILRALMVFALGGCQWPNSLVTDTWKVTIGPTDHGVLSADPAQGEEGTPVTLTATPEQGYVLKSGSLKAENADGRELLLEGSGNTYSFAMPGADVRVSAEFEALPDGYHAVHIPFFAHGGITASPASAPAGAAIALTVNAAEGYALKEGSLAVADAEGVSVAVTGEGTAYAFVMPGTEATVAAEFEALGDGVYSVSIAQTRGGTITANPAKAEPETVVILTVTPAEGYRLKEGSLKANGGDLAGSGPTLTFFMPQSHVKVTAEFELLPDGKRAVIIPRFANGSIAADPARAEPGSPVALSISPAGGYALKPESLALAYASGATVILEGSGLAYSFVMPDADVTVAAKFESLEAGIYSISIDKIQNGTINADPPNAAAETPVSLTVTPAPGHLLKAGSVAVNDVALSGSGSAYTFVMPASHVTARAEFEAIVYNITIPETAKGSITADRTGATVGETVSLTVTPGQGCALKAGSLRINGGAAPLGGSGSAYTFAMPASDVTVSAEFEAIGYSIAIAPMSGGSIAADRETAAAGETVALVISPEAGYRIKDGFPRANGGSIGGSGDSRSFAMPQANVTVTAEFEAVLWTIGFAAMTRGSVSADPPAAAAGSAVTLTVTPDPDYGLKAGSLKVNDGAAALSGSGTAYVFAMPLGNVTVSAEFEVLPSGLRTVGIDPAILNGTVEADYAGAEEGTEITLTVAPNQGYALKAGSLKINDGAVAASPSLFSWIFVMPAANVMITAEFEAISYPVVIVSPAHGVVAADKETAIIGETVSLTATPGQGYVLKANSLKVNNSVMAVNSSGAASFRMPAAGVTVTAEFEGISYAIVIGSPAHGAVTANKQTAIIGETVVLTANPDPGYTLKAGTLKANNGGVTVSPSNAAYVFVMPPAEVAIAAEFEPASYTISLASLLHGELAADKQTAVMGETVSLTATPDQGYVLKADSLKVNNGAVSLDDSFSFVMPPANVTVGAEFEAIRYSISIASMTHGSVEADPETASLGASVALRVKPDEGYALKAGTLKANNEEVSGQGFVMPAGAVTVTAEFEAVRYAINAGGLSNGTVSVSVEGETATGATMGQTVVLTPRPDGTAQLAAGSLAATDAGGGAQTLSPGGDGSFSFVMPASGVTVSAEFVIPLTADLAFPAEPNDGFGVTQTGWEGEGATQTWILAAGEEPRVYFAVSKAADQAITIGGTDAEKVEAAIPGETAEGFVVPPLSGALAVYAVDMEDLIFDGDFDQGTPERSFTLTATEAGHSDITYAMRLRPSLDTDATATLYRRAEGRWLRIRNPTLSGANVYYSIGARSSLEGVIRAKAPVRDLETAFAWVCFNAESGTGQNTKPGTTAGYSEYRIFLKADQQIGPIFVRYPEAVNYVSLELYGAGSPGGAERTITRNIQWNGTSFKLYNGSSLASSEGLISIQRNFNDQTHILILGKNVTLSGNNEFTGFSSGLRQMEVSALLEIYFGDLVIMKDHAKITGYNSNYTHDWVPILITTSGATRRSIFYMEGGEISGNTFHNSMGVAFLHGRDSNSFYKTGGVITGNTRDRVVQYDIDVEVDDITVPPPGWPAE